MKKWTISSLIMLLSLSLSAQLDFGLRAGVGLAKTGISDFQSTQQAIQTLEGADRELSYHLGIYAKIKTPLLFIQPEIIFSQVNQSVDANQVGATNPRNLELDVSRVDIPLLVGKKLGPVRLLAGPVYSANISDLTGDISSDLESGTFGYQVGVGVEIRKFMLDIRYEGAFSSFASNLIVDQTNYQVDLRTNQLMVCLGFELF